MLGAEINASLPFAYVGAFGALLLMQWVLQKPIAHAYLENQRMNNRVTAQGYGAWDNILSGNSYNLRLWLFGFKARLREGLVAQIRAIVAREGMSAMSGIVSLAIVFATISVVAHAKCRRYRAPGRACDVLPRQIEMTYELHLLASGWNDFIAIWTRFGGVADNMLPKPDFAFDERIKFDRLVLREDDHANVVSSLGDALRIAFARPTGRINVRGGNGAGKSSLLASLKTEMKKRATIRPTTDRLAFQFTGGEVPVDVEGDDEDEVVVVAELMDKKLGFSSGERQLKSLEEIVARPTRKSICSTNGMPISMLSTRPRPTPWSMRSRPAPASSKSPIATGSPERAVMAKALVSVSSWHGSGCVAAS